MDRAYMGFLRGSSFLGQRFPDSELMEFQALSMGNSGTCEFSCSRIGVLCSVISGGL